KKFSEVEAENNELKAENVKLEQALEEHESRFIKLEQNNKDTDSENAELKARVAKLEQKQSQSGNSITKLGDIPSTSNKMENSDSRSEVAIASEPSSRRLAHANASASDISDNISNPDICHESPSRYLASPIRTET
ncbi:11601_t:CDS:2, partial [Acaulospora colombiana]